MKDDVFVRTSFSDYGPRKRNPIYESTNGRGVAYTVQRHKWTIPSVSWGWCAAPCTRGADVTIYAETLEDVAFKLGRLDDFERRKPSPPASQRHYVRSAP